MPKIKRTYTEGTWFAVPLDKKGYAIGLVARVGPIGHVILAYFFGPRTSRIPDIKQLENQTKRDSVKAIRVTDMGLVNGEWPIIGQSENWRRKEWPIPRFVRCDPITDCVFLIQYSDDNPVEEIGMKRMRSDHTGYEGDSLWGHRVVVEELSELLKLD